MTKQVRLTNAQIAVINIDTMAKQKVGLFGGTFNPIHNGHLVCAKNVVERLGLTRMLFIPSASPVHKPAPNLAPADDRLRMCQLATDPIPNFETSDIEIRRKEPSYTVITLEQLHEQSAGQCEFYFLVGSDNIPILHTWKDIDRILELCQLVTIPRRGYPVSQIDELTGLLSAEQIANIRRYWLSLTIIDISSSEIRGRVRAGKSISDLVPAPVADYIQSRGLYR